MQDESEGWVEKGGDVSVLLGELGRVYGEVEPNDRGWVKVGDWWGIHGVGDSSMGGEFLTLIHRNVW